MLWAAPALQGVCTQLAVFAHGGEIWSCAVEVSQPPGPHDLFAMVSGLPGRGSGGRPACSAAGSCVWRLRLAVRSRPLLRGQGDEVSVDQWVPRSSLPSGRDSASTQCLHVAAVLLRGHQGLVPDTSSRRVDVTLPVLHRLVFKRLCRAAVSRVPRPVLLPWLLGTRSCDVCLEQMLYESLAPARSVTCLLLVPCPAVQPLACMSPYFRACDRRYHYFSHYSFLFLDHFRVIPTYFS